MRLSIQKHHITYDVKEKIFTVSGKNTNFTTSYNVVNDDTKKEVKFELSHSTGSEWDPKTVWVYKSECENYKLHVLNDDVTPQQAENYLQAKIRN